MREEKKEEVVNNVSPERLFLPGLACLILVLAISSASFDSVTHDEMHFLGFGHYLVKTASGHWGEYRQDAPLLKAPPIPHYVLSAPFFAYDAYGALPDIGTAKAEKLAPDALPCRGCYMRSFGLPYILSQQYARLKLLTLSRAVNTLILIASAILLAGIIRGIWGFRAAAAVTAIYALDPNMLAHARLATPYILPALMSLISFVYLVEYAKTGTKGQAMRSGAVLGIALLTDFKAVYLIPLFLVFALHSPSARKNGKKELARQMLYAFLVAWLVLCSGYLFKDMAAGYAQPSSLAGDLLSYNPLPLPSQYTEGLRDWGDPMGPHMDYHKGMAVSPAVNVRGRMGYWATTLLLKLPEATLALFIIAAGYHLLAYIGLISYGGEEELMMNRYLVLHAIASLYPIAACSHLYGIKEILYAFPLWFMLLASPIKALFKSRAGAKVAVLLVITAILPTFISYPQYIPYFNSFMGAGMQPYYFADSNVDYGQDINRLSSYMRKNGLRSMRMSLSGPATPEEMGLDASADIGCTPTSGLLAISSTHVSEGHIKGWPSPCYRWLSRHEPVQSIGSSIYVYDIKLRSRIIEDRFLNELILIPGFEHVGVADYPTNDLFNFQHRRENHTYYITISYDIGRDKDLHRYRRSESGLHKWVYLSKKGMDPVHHMYIWVYDDATLSVSSEDGGPRLLEMTEHVLEAFPPTSDLFIKDWE